MTIDDIIHALSNALITINYFVEDVENGAVESLPEESKKSINQVRAAIANLELATAALRDLRA